MPTTHPTAKQQQVLDFVKEYIDQWGSAPTFREVGDKLGIHAATVLRHLDALEARELITRQANESRSIQLRVK